MKKSLDFLNEYLSIIVLMPAIIGGLYQLINIIYYVGFPYVRFFSVTQVIPDGLLIGVFILFFLIIYFLPILTFRFFSLTSDMPGGLKSKFIIIIFTVLLFIYSTYMLFVYNPDTMIGSILVDFFWSNIIFMSLGVFVIVMTNITISDDFNVMKVMYWLIFIFYFVFFANSLGSKINTINDNIINDFGFYNSNVVINKIIEKTKTTEINLLYANRDYLFFSIVKNGQRQILVEDAKKLITLDDKESK